MTKNNGNGGNGNQNDGHQRPTPPRPDPVAARSTENIRREAEQRRTEHVQRINAERRAPQLHHVPTPSGNVVKEVHTPETARQNKEIDQKIERYREGVKVAKGRARDEFARRR